MKAYVYALLIALLCGLGTNAKASQTDPDKLERVPIKLKDGTVVYHVKYLNRNWREADPEILKSKATSNEDVCFEAKFDAITANTLSLFKQEGHLICDSIKLKKFLRTLGTADNIWICGKLRARKGAKGVELVVVDVTKMKGDLHRFRVKSKQHIARKDIPKLMALGHRIRKALESNLVSFNEHDQLLEIQSLCWKTALNLQRSQLEADDSDGLFLIAVEWKDLMHKTHKYHEFVRKVLRMDPDHRKAGEVAIEEMGLVRFHGDWMTPKEKQAILKSEQDEQNRLTEAKNKAEEAQAKARLVAISNRTRLLGNFQRALRTQDVNGLETAIRRLGEAIKHTLDPEFGRLGIDILSNLGDPAAIFPGMALASKSSIREVRVYAYQALAFVGSNTALQVFATALNVESETKIAKAGVQALMQRKDLGKPVIAALINGLQNENPKIDLEVVAGLKKYTGLKHGDKDTWLDWWNTNRERKDLPVAPD